MSRATMTKSVVSMMGRTWWAMPSGGFSLGELTITVFVEGKHCCHGAL